jgi:hypothetical protein
VTENDTGKTERQRSVPHLGPQRDEVETLWFCLKKELIAGCIIPNIVSYYIAD